MQSLARSLALVVIVAGVSAGFLYGRALGARVHTHSDYPGSRLTYLTRPPSASSEGADASVAPIDVFDSVLDHVQHEFVEGGEVCDNARLSAAALSRMVAALDDPGARYLDPQSAAAYQAQQDGSFQGIGAALTVTRTRRQDVEYRYLCVEDVMPGSPAQRAGMISGDRITSIDGHWVIAYSSRSDGDRAEHDSAPRGRAGSGVHDGGVSNGITLSRAIQRLTSGSGAHLAITVERAGAVAPVQVALETAETSIEPAEFHMIGDRVIYLRIHELGARAESAIESALSTSVGSARGVVVDLRGCPGGVKLPTGVDGLVCAERLLSLLGRGGPVALIERHAGQRSALRVESSATSVRQVVVLIDSGTANLAELVAAGLRDSAHARLIGSRSFGDNALSLFATLKSGAALKVTTAHLFTAGGTDISRGITPDITVPPVIEGAPDAALDRAIMVLQG